MIGIITITYGQNFGNRLQNYALQTYLDKNGVINETIFQISYENDTLYRVKQMLKSTIFFLKYKNQIIRKRNFKEFNKKIKFSSFSMSNTKIPLKKLEKYEKFIAGSDQIWNLNYKDNSIVYFLGFCDKSKKISYAPSFGANNIPENLDVNIIKWLNDIPNLSVREEAGKKIINKLTGRTDIEVLIDPTMLLTSEEWNEIAKKPKRLKNNKYILNYFLGELSAKRKKEIERIAKEYKCEIINILDKNSPYYECGPSEFLYLEKNAFLICTDSFHSSVFAVLYNRPFVIFDREQENVVSMNSRLETLINKFNLKNRKFEGKITEENLNHDYTKAYEILDKERKKAEKFLRDALDIKG